MERADRHLDFSSSFFWKTTSVHSTPRLQGTDSVLDVMPEGRGHGGRAVPGLVRASNMTSVSSFFPTSEIAAASLSTQYSAILRAYSYVGRSAFPVEFRLFFFFGCFVV